MRIHFVGIGGIGVSALAKYYLEKNHQVTGSDLFSSEITTSLEKIGAKIYIGNHKSSNIKSKDFKTELPELVIFSPAVQSNNPELKKAKELKIKCLSYPQALGELTKNHFTIAISGMHGKSTTTAIIGLLLTKGGFDPTVIVGTKLKEFGDSNCRVGKSQYLVIEADEHFASFLNYWPKIIILTNIEKDHLDYYKNFGNILKTFKKYVSHLPKEGILIANKDDKNIYSIFSKSSKNVKWYSLKQKETEKLKKILKVPGEFNISNSLAALTLARTLKIPDKISFKTFSKYKGSWRRFEEKLTTFNGKRIKIISDYGHHPTEIKVTLAAAREKYPKKKIWLVYQPHQYQRTYYLFDDFAKVFREAPVDKLIITDIYDVAGREKKEIKEKVNSEKLIKKIRTYKTSLLHSDKVLEKKFLYLSNFEEIKNYLKENLQGREVVIIMGAGNIYNLFIDLTDKEKKVKL